MDVEVVRPFDSLLGLKTMLCWQKGCDGLEVATFGAEKGSKWVKECLDYYQNREFILHDGSCSVKPLPNIVEDILRHKGYKLVDCSSIAYAKNTERQYAERTTVMSYQYLQTTFSARVRMMTLRHASQTTHILYTILQEHGFHGIVG